VQRMEPEDLNNSGTFRRRSEFSTLVDVLIAGCTLHRKQSPKAHGRENRVTSLAVSFLLPVDPILADSIYPKSSSPI
jgi:hypothetical protein